MAGSETAPTHAHNAFDMGGVQFHSKFDNGNLQRVERVVGGGPYDYKIWSAYDNHGTHHQSKHCSWFHFSITGLPADVMLKLYLINGGHHNNLYKYDMRPVFRCNNTNNKWVRLRLPVKQRRSESGETILLMEHQVDADNDRIYFAFTYPYSYSNLLTDLAVLDTHTNNFEDQDSIVAYREHLVSTQEARRVELITITSAEGASEDREPPLPGLFPDILDNSDLMKRPRIFPYKEVIFVSSRVHPGEVPAQHVWKGMFQFLMDPNDLCARALRARYVIKMVPMLNPDGVFHGHFRMDQLGQNLNRYYIDTDQTLQPSIFAAKALLDYYSNNKSLSLYIDLHAHASKRGCFIYGNVLDNIDDQIQNQLFCKLISLNTPHFDYEGCLFNKEHMSRIDPGDLASGLTAEGSGRVSTYLSHGLVHSYTLECNYNCSRFGNEINATEIETGGQFNTPASPFTANPEKFTPSIYWGVGRACLIAMLDIRGQNPSSRITKSKIKSLEKVRNAIVCEVRQKKDFKGGAASDRKPRSNTSREISESIDARNEDVLENVVVSAPAAKEGKERDFVMSDHHISGGRGMTWRRTISSPATTVRMASASAVTVSQQQIKTMPIKNISPIDVISNLTSKANSNNNNNANAKSILIPAVKKAIAGKVFQNDLLQPHKPSLHNTNSDTTTTGSRRKGVGKRLQLATDGLSYLINNTPSDVLNAGKNASTESNKNNIHGGSSGGNITLGSASANTTQRSGIHSAKVAYENIKTKAMQNASGECATTALPRNSNRADSTSNNNNNNNNNNPEIASERDDVMPPILLTRSSSTGPFEGAVIKYSHNHSNQQHEQHHHHLQALSPSFSPSTSLNPSNNYIKVVYERDSVDGGLLETRKLDVNVDKSPSQSRFLPKLDVDDINMALESLNRQSKKTTTTTPNKHPEDESEYKAYNERSPGLNSGRSKSKLKLNTLQLSTDKVPDESLNNKTVPVNE